MRFVVIASAAHAARCRVIQAVAPALSGVLLAMLFVLGQSPLWAENVTITGSVQYRNLTSDPYEPHRGEVLDGATGKPVAGAQVDIPQLGFRVSADGQGHFMMPPLPQKPVILRVKQAGYAPRTMTLEGQPTDNRAFQVRLARESRTVVLDDRLFHLGDGSYAPASAGAARFQAPTSGTVLVKEFKLAGQLDGPHVTLGIGSIVGLDTREAHQAGQSQFHKTSTPMEVWINGRPIARIGVNGDGTRIPIPSDVLSPTGVNRLEIRTGYQSPDGQRIDYDDMELMLLTLTF